MRPTLFATAALTVLALASGATLAQQLPRPGQGAQPNDSTSGPGTQSQRDPGDVGPGTQPQRQMPPGAQQPQRQQPPGAQQPQRQPPAAQQAPRQMPPGAQQPPAAQRPPAGPPPGGPDQQAGPAPARPYKAVAVTRNLAPQDPSLDAFRRNLAAIAQRKDRNALARVVVTRGFFWEGGQIDENKPGIDNLAAALQLDGQDAQGWETLAIFANDPSAEPIPDQPGLVCSPAGVQYNEQEMEEIGQQTQTEASDWAYPVSAGLEVRMRPDNNAQVVERLGMHVVRVMPEENPSAGGEEWIRIVTPSGKMGYVRIDRLLPLITDQLCYIKEQNVWKIAGFVGGGGDGQQ